MVIVVVGDRSAVAAPLAKLGYQVVAARPSSASSVPVGALPRRRSSLLLAALAAFDGQLVDADLRRLRRRGRGA